MKNKKTFFFIFFTAVILSIVSFTYLNQRPVHFFVLKAGDNRAQAFQIDVYLNRRLSTLTSLPLNRPEELNAVQILSSQNISQLRSLAAGLGSFDFVLGTSASNSDMNVFWTDFLTGKSLTDSFSNLTEMDRLYFRWKADHELTVLSTGEATTKTASVSIEATAASTAAVPVKNSASEPIVRVEILNGCGIKGAADWVVSRIASQTIKAKNGGNAVNFNYPDSQILCAAAVSPGFTKALAALGFSKLTPISSKTIPAGYDAVLIVGKDFRAIRGN